MLDDGFLRNPMVQVARVSTKQGINLAPPQSTQIASHAQVVKGEPLKITKVPLFSSQLLTNSPVRIQIVDRKSGTGIPKAAMLLGGKIYQTNKSGEMTVQTSTGMMVLMADGYRILQSPIEVFIKAASKSKIIMEPLPFANEIKVQVVDGFTQKPLKDALIKLNQMRVKTNSKGLFRITDIATEFGEIEVSKNGYKTLKKTIDFKDPSERVFPLIPHE
ncbi:hypothetical protein HYY75_00820 [bacterium]|nr:hypothetical protein [bacterium]